MTPNVGRSSAELWPNSLMLPSRTEPKIRPNPSAELRRLPNFGPSLASTLLLALVVVVVVIAVAIAVVVVVVVAVHSLTEQQTKHC